MPCQCHCVEHRQVIEIQTRAYDMYGGTFKQIEAVNYNMYKYNSYTLSLHTQVRFRLRWQPSLTPELRY